MKRKTNLFYNSGPDSKFLTFSNYTEALTGNFLSTNTKLFPSAFICFNIPSLTADNKESFIKDYLISRYENKLAALRDINQEAVLPLNYLIETILTFDETSEISYIGNITEQDYMGSYTDTICIIDSKDMISAEIVEVESTATYTNDIESTLYGWYDNGVYLGPTVYSDLTPVFDIDNKYRIDSKYKLTYNTSSNIDSVVFNVLVPLYRLVNINVNSQSELNDDLTSALETSAFINCPLGIWFADKTIELDRGNDYGQSWSLTIGSQFKPLPMSAEIKSDISKDSNDEAFKTFSQILCKQNELLNKFQMLTNQIDNINKKLISIENRPSDVDYKTETGLINLKLDKINTEVSTIKRTLNIN